MKGSIHIGISGWSYPDWKGIFYPEKLKSTDWITFYAKTFDTTELNASFYRLPLKQTVINWGMKVPPGFKFCPKMSRYLTHIQRLKEPEEPLQRFFEIFSPIKEHLGPVLIQLPPSLIFDLDIATHLFDVLKNSYGEYEFALEARHKSWTETEAISLIGQYNIAWVISQSGVGFPYLEEVTARNIYFRFHGPGKLYASSYTLDMLQLFALQFKKWQEEGHNIWIYFNNCYFGYAIENANTLKELLHL